MSDNKPFGVLSNAQFPLPPCPNCGDASGGFSANATFVGPGSIHYSQNGHYEESFSDHSEIKRIGSVRCGQCGKIRRDLMVVGNKVVSK